MSFVASEDGTQQNSESEPPGTKARRTKNRTVTEKTVQLIQARVDVSERSPKRPASRRVSNGQSITELAPATPVSQERNRLDQVVLPTLSASDVSTLETNSNSETIAVPLFVTSRNQTTPKTKAFRKRFFPDATDREWNDWRWQARNRIRKLDQFEAMLRLSENEREGIQKGGSMLPVGITPYYMSLLDADDSEQALRKTVVPRADEFLRTRGEADDPLGEDGHSPVPGLVHRYPDRVLLLALDFCSTYCRYCTRSRVVGHGEILPNEKRLEAAFEYLRQNTQIRDVLISGGDPLALAEDKLDWILSRLRSIPHIEFVRIGTKMPAV
ncbi:MAG: hypothetical protein JNK90_22225, partial [Planctomycetaceae bacterium]|nr:hypothetical protein [Planctomycetaceae bacterium]